MMKRIAAVLLAVVVALGIMPVLAETPAMFHLTIHYVAQDSSAPLAADYSARIAAGSEYSVDSPSVNNYALADKKQAVISGTITADTEFTVRYRWAAEEAEYTVRCWKGEIGEHPVLMREYTDKAPVGSTVIIPEFQFDGTTREPADMTLVVTADGKAVRNLYFEQDLPPALIFHTGGSYVPPIIEAPGTDISSKTAALPTPTRRGWVFDGWNKPLPNVMGSETTEYTALWQPGVSNYTVEYFFQNITDDGYSRVSELDTVRQATTESTAAASQWDMDQPTVNRLDTSSHFYGFEYSHCEPCVVTDDDEAVLKIYYNWEIWKVKIYNVPYNLKPNMTESDLGDDKLWKEFSGRYNELYPDNYPDFNELFDHMNPLKPAKLPADYKFTNLAVACKSTGTVLTSNYTHFSNESIPGSRELLLVPYYSNQQSFDHVLVKYTQKIGHETADELWNDDTWEWIDTEETTNLYTGYNLTVNLGNAYEAERYDDPDGEPVLMMFRTGSTKKHAEKPLGYS